MRPLSSLLPLAALALVAAGLSGCARFPELDATATPGVAEAPFPKLVPLDGLLEEQAPPRATPEVITEVEARAAGLQARAGGLQSVASPASGAGLSPVEQRLKRLRQKAEALRAAN